MLIYILKWTDCDSSDQIDNFKAFSGQGAASKEWRKLKKMADTDMDIILLDEEDAIRKHDFKPTKKNIIDIINSI